METCLIKCDFRRETKTEGLGVVNSCITHYITIIPSAGLLSLSFTWLSWQFCLCLSCWWAAKVRNFKMATLTGLLESHRLLRLCCQAGIVNVERQRFKIRETPTWLGAEKLWYCNPTLRDYLHHWRSGGVKIWTWPAKQANSLNHPYHIQPVVRVIITDSFLV